ncbi:MAG: 2-hydroxyacid dehydrogenase [Verrucomicrobia bacterium]|nr:2-hydroxyacid dehydrogenase [Verrucomicrobiota bacterium]MCH8526876.1 2-hydroxyacid dehydrogenase [Kiritimatiellia bacterium]
MPIAVFDTKPYDREFLSAAAGAKECEHHFHSFRLEAATASAAEGAHTACIFVNDHANRESLEALAGGGVKHIALRCAGFNNVDLDAAKALGLLVTRVPGYSPHAVAEHTLALLLALNRRIHRAYNRVREMNFSLSGLVGFDLQGKTAGVVGTGRTGALVAQIFRGFGMEVLAFDPYPNADWAEKHGVRYVDKEELLAHSDVISLHLPLTPETRHMINGDTLNTVKTGAYLVNVSRGALVDTSAVITALKSGKLGGVALDVYEEEEGVFFEDLSGEVMQDDELARLLTFPNVLITSHQAFLTREALHEIARVTTENILRLHRGEPPLDGTLL